ncbi:MULTISPECIES: lipopolysaccharide assembly protein LapA domain-containing protein [Rhodovulum]|uniref:Uncharacterized protein DUF1049 n=2 Tax=Rhodovulum TaxID=34008 RepID=A0A8E2VML1_9RHOB|nr:MULTISPECIES: lipopolysaccharide assembly protein LapA domain-containing protein [Rhodovulum]PTW51233.1 uncharacterized protein DUF1049 [Rhodovulum kholense]RAP41019.1 DUF1049 domain-containing protein [Rhodovulum viride]
MRLIRYLFLVLLAICLVVVATANLDPVSVTLLPGELATYSGFQFTAEVPLYVVGFGGMLLGLLIGFFWEWLRESKHRSVASRQRRETARMQRELDRLQAEKRRNDGHDDVLALIEKGGTR